MLTSALSTVLGFANPYFLYRILGWIQANSQSDREDIDRSKGWTLIFTLFLCNVLSAIISGQLYFHGRRVGRTIRAVLISQIFAKSLRRVAGVAAPSESADKGVESDAETSLGKIATLMSVDSERFAEFMCYIQDPLINFPVSITLAFVGLYSVLGMSSLAGLGVIILTGPIATILGKWVDKIQEDYMKSVDKRVAVTNETLNGIRIIKYFSWEPQFAAKIVAARAVEIKNLLKLNFLYISLNIVNFSMSILCFFVTFAVYTLVEGKELDAATAFSGVMLLERLTELLGWMPQLVLWAMKSKVALQRIAGFLEEEEIELYSQDKTSLGEDCAGGAGVGFRKATFRYFLKEDMDKSSSKKMRSQSRIVERGRPAYQALNVVGEDFGDDIEPGNAFSLKDVTIDFVVGGLNVVTGPTGSGKSSLILSLLGEMKTLNGQTFCHTGIEDRPPVAYVAQTAWLLNDTIRENILMGLDFDEQKYKQTLEACALVRDLETFPGGDLTEIGEKGVSISGGQKQRISLARAVYSNASIVLLDDPLSAVDAPTARSLLKNAILSRLKGRTVILVTHAVGLVVPFADHIVVIQNGVVISQGSPSDIANDPSVEEITTQTISQSQVLGDCADEAVSAVVSSAESATKLVDEEKRATGGVELRIYKTYWRACGGLFFLTMFVLFQLLQSGMRVSTDWWLSKWTSATNGTASAEYFSASSLWLSTELYSNQMLSTATKTGAFYFNSVTKFTGHEETVHFILIYGLLSLLKVVISVFLNLANVMGGIRASRSLHLLLLQSVLGAPLRFFETTPLGRILNRFSKDIATIDEDVMNSMAYFAYQLVRGLTIVMVISTTAPWFLVAFVPILVAYGSITRKYLAVSRELKRLQSVTRSPIFSLFSECLAGVATVRAYGQTRRFELRTSARVDTNHKAFYLLWAANRWLCIRTDTISAFVVLCAGGAVVAGRVSAGWAALTLLYAGQFSEALLWVVRMHADMEMSLNSVERCQEYIDLEQEEKIGSEDSFVKPPESWPSNGIVEVEKLAVRYGGSEQPLVLKGVSFTTRPGEKIGVVGRTGAGKSTLSLAFFRIVPIAEGSITIDGIDISKMKLSDLRSKLTIIPQDPVLFSGTVRSNLDPHGDCDDAELYRILRATQLLETISDECLSLGSSSSTLMSTPSVDSLQIEDSIDDLKASKVSITLDTPVTENGANFSQGQRQLLCMARALLRKSKLIFLDEATASIDSATDAKIQATIRREMCDATVLTIAHRLKTVADCDRVLVLDEGRVAEFGTPEELIGRADGHFRRMCEDSGDLAELVEIAQSRK
ncbi:hypothetical protein HDU82_000940 [Entophlyctis luteolus]|nr:hypothetical protein HDU82_000940 [Entophlyctis luteolus]